SIGTHGLRLYSDPMWKYFSVIPTNEKSFVSSEAMAQIVERYNHNVLRFYDGLLKFGVDFYVLVCCPMPLAQWRARRKIFNTPEEFSALVDSFQDIAVEMMLKRGIRVLRPPVSV